MPNTIKYSTSGDTQSLKKGNFFIGVGDVPKGPSNTTGHWQGITPPTSGYTIYINVGSGSTAIMVPENDTKLVEYANGMNNNTNYISNGGNFSSGSLTPFSNTYSSPGGVVQVTSITNDRPYVGSASRNAMYMNYNGGGIMSTTGLLTTGVTYTFSFWAKIISGSSFSISWNNQNGSGDTNAWTSSANLTTGWRRYIQTFTLNASKNNFYFYSRSADTSLAAVITEFQLMTGSTYGGPGLQNATEALRWFSDVSLDEVCVNRDYETIVTDGLSLNMDAGFTPSYPRTGTTWYDLSYSGFNCSLINGPSYSSINGGGLICDGVDDYILQTSPTATTFSIEITYSPLSFNTNPGTNRYNYVLSSFGSNIFLRYNTLNSGDSMLLANHSGSDISIGSLGHQINGIYNITITFNDSTKQTNVYLNGVLRTSTTYNATLRYIGSRQLGATFNSIFYSYKVYNRILNDSEVLQNYQSQLLKFLGQNVVMNGIDLYLDAGYVTSYPTSGTTWTNISGISGGVGSLINGPSYTTLGGGSIDFDGTNDYVSISSPSTMMSKTSYTKTAWFNFDVLTYNIISGGDTAQHAFWMAGTNKLNAGHNSNWSTVQSTTTLTAGVWYYGAVTFDTTNGWKLYLNGVQESTSSSTATFNGANDILFIGAYNAAQNLFNGKIATAQIYDRVLSQTEISQNFNAQKSRFGL